MALYKRILALFYASLLVVALSACADVSAAGGPSGVSSGGQPANFQPASSLSPEIGSALSAFSVDLFKRSVSKGNGGNELLSPLSLWLALGMAYNGASGSTAAEMAGALHVSGIPVDDLNKANAGLLGVLAAADPKAQISVADSLWLSKLYEKKIDRAFLDVARNNYAAEVRTLDFINPGSADTMNGWVKKNTGGRIADIVQPPFDPQTAMILIDAVYFNAPWKTSFDENATRDEAFTLAGGAKAQARFMFRARDNTGYADDAVEAVRLPYASGRLEMAAVMPEKQTLGEFVSSLTPETLRSYIDACGVDVGSLKLPKFKFECGAELRNTLSAMGMKDAFDPKAAAFGKMIDGGDGKACLSNVLVKSYIEVDEAGTKAAGAAAVIVTAAATAPPAARKDLVFDKPFVFLIRDTMTGAILFIGAVEDPKKSPFPVEMGKGVGG